MEWSERIGRRIRLRDLHILLAVVQCRSMAKAAEHLAISRPVISRAINDLEHVLGVRLLERDRHGAEPTIYGAALLKRGAIVFDELRESVKDIEFLADPTAGEVRIGCHPFLAPTFITAVIDRFSQRYPRIVFRLVATQAEILYRELILLHHKFRRRFRGKRRAQHWHLRRVVAIATANRRWIVAIELGTWRCGRIGGAAGSITTGNGRFFDSSGGMWS